MVNVIIAERKGEGLSQKLDALLADCGAHDVQRQLLHPEDVHAGVYECDLAIISPELAALETLSGAQISCGILLLPDGASAGYATCGCLVTYGLSARSTITLSAIGEDSRVVAILRELVTVHGDVLDRQEICISDSSEPDAALALTGAALLLGYRPKNARLDELLLH